MYSVLFSDSKLHVPPSLLLPNLAVTPHPNSRAQAPDYSLQGLLSRHVPNSLYPHSTHSSSKSSAALGWLQMALSTSLPQKLLLVSQELEMSPLWQALVSELHILWVT